MNQRLVELFRKPVANRTGHDLGHGNERVVHQLVANLNAGTHLVEVQGRPGRVGLDRQNFAVLLVPIRLLNVFAQRHVHAVGANLKERGQLGRNRLVIDHVENATIHLMSHQLRATAVIQRRLLAHRIGLKRVVDADGMRARNSGTDLVAAATAQVGKHPADGLGDLGAFKPAKLAMHGQRLDFAGRLAPVLRHDQARLVDAGQHGRNLGPGNFALFFDFVLLMPYVHFFGESSDFRRPVFSLGGVVSRKIGEFVELSRKIGDLPGEPLLIGVHECSLFRWLPATTGSQRIQHVANFPAKLSFGREQVFQHRQDTRVFRAQLNHHGKR